MTAEHDGEAAAARSRAAGLVRLGIWRWTSSQCHALLDVLGYGAAAAAGDEGTGRREGNPGVGATTQAASGGGSSGQQQRVPAAAGAVVGAARREGERGGGGAAGRG